MEIIRLGSKTISTAEIIKVINVLKKDGLVIIPTDTVYGLAGNAFSGQAIEKIYELKQRPKNKPFIIFVPDIDFTKKLKIKITPKIRKLLHAFWPGPVTFIFKIVSLSSRFLKVKRGLSKRSKTIAVRIPEHPVVLAILRRFNDPLMVTSANISGAVSPFDFDQIDADILKKTDLSIDAGRCRFGVISTIVDVSESKLKILREGAVPAEKIIKVWNSRACIGEINEKKGNKNSK